MAQDTPTPRTPDDAVDPAARAAVEVEVKFELGAEDGLPDLSAVAVTGETREHLLRAVYLDTPDLFLIRRKATLRRREGGDDAGWHLKVPAEGHRRELHAPLTEGDGRWRVPAGHLAALAEHLGDEWAARGPADRGLVPAAVLTTRRLETDLLDPEGRVLAVLCDDEVHAMPADRRWRELEVELVEGADPGLLSRVVEVFAEQGVTVAESPSKLARALEDEVQRAERGKGPRRKGAAARVVVTHVAEQLAVLRGREEDLRTDEPGAVHKSRVATRRLRSALRTFDGLFDPAALAPLREELKWYAGVLGGPRDAEVVRERILAEIDDVPRADYEGPVKRSSTAELNRRHREAHEALVAVLDSTRYAALLDALAEFVAAPPLRPRASRPAAEVLPHLVDKAVARVEKAHRAARAAEGDERLPLLHETRKKAKAARYAFETIAPTFGEDAAEQAVLWERVTESLGQVQDIEVALGVLRSLRAAAAAKDEPTYTYGYLVGRQTAALGPAVVAGEAALEEAMRAALAGR